MSNPLEIEILTKYLGADQARAAAADLEKVRQGSKDAGAATDATVPQMEEAAKASEGLGINHRALHMILREIASQSPITGASLEIGLLGTVGAIMAVVELFRAAKKALGEYNDELDAAGEAAAQPLDSGVVGLQEAWKTATTKLAEYYSALETAGEGKDPIDAEITNIKKRDEIEYDGIKKIIEALGKEEEAQIRVNDAKNPAKLKTDLDELHKRQQANLDQLDDWKDSRTEGALLTERAMRQNDQDAANAEVQKNSAIAQAADDKLKNNQAVIDNLTKATDPLTNEERKKHNRTDPRINQEDAKAKMDALTSSGQVVIKNGEAFGFTPEAKKEYKDASDKLNAANAEIADQQKLLADAKAAAQEIQKEKDNADTRLKGATDSGTKDANRIDEINTELPNVQGQDDLRQKFRTIAQDVPEAESKNKKAGADIHDQSSHDEAVRQLKDSQRVGRELATAAKEAAAAHSASLTVILQALNDLRGSNENLQQQINYAKNWAQSH